MGAIDHTKRGKLSDPLLTAAKQNDIRKARLHNPTINACYNAFQAANEPMHMVDGECEEFYIFLAFHLYGENESLRKQLLNQARTNIPPTFGDIKAAAKEFDRVDRVDREQLKPGKEV